MIKKLRNQPSNLPNVLIFSLNTCLQNELCFQASFAFPEPAYQHAIRRQSFLPSSWLQNCSEVCALSLHKNSLQFTETSLPRNFIKILGICCSASLWDGFGKSSCASYWQIHKCHESRCARASIIKAMCMAMRECRTVVLLLGNVELHHSCLPTMFYQLQMIAIGVSKSMLRLEITRKILKCWCESCGGNVWCFFDGIAG